ncbi:MAG: GNAT family N-acetyltransferase [Chloroflexi bacterium]|nr:GNAT family N-acetyltransferase [Chloroflexota bacterium]
MFETARLRVRHFEPSDLDDFAALCADATAMRYMDDGTVLPRSEVERWIGICQMKYATRGYGTSAVFEKASGKFVGFSGVVRAPENDFDELIYAFHVEAWGKGYATESGRAMVDYVFARSTLTRIYATIHPDNKPSQHVIGKLGFRFEEQVVNDDGSLTNVYVIERKQGE